MAVVVFDTSVLLLAIHPDASPPSDPETQKPLEHAKQRVDYLIRRLHKGRTKVVIPSPALSELLVHAGTAVNGYLQKLQQTPFSVASFDTRAAIECAEAVRKYGLKDKGQNNPRAKIKFDRQIVAIAQVAGADTIYSDDADIFSYGKQAGIKVIRSYELELDPEERQHKLDLEMIMQEPEAAENSES